MFKVGGFKSGKNLQQQASVFDVSRLAPLGSAGDHFIEEYTEVSSQGNLSTCVSNAVADTVEICVGLVDPSKVEQVSRLQIYYNSRCMHGAQAVDQGTFVYMGLHQARDIGICPEKIWPYIEANVNVAPPLEASIYGGDNKIKGFYKVLEEGQAKADAFAAAIRRNHPVIFGTLVSDSFRYLLDSKPITIPEKGDPIIGGHALVAVGVESYAGRLRFKIRNSWSKDWGVGGYCWMDQDYIIWKSTEDSHVVTHADPFI